MGLYRVTEPFEDYDGQQFQSGHEFEGELVKRGLSDSNVYWNIVSNGVVLAVFEGPVGTKLKRILERPEQRIEEDA